MLPLELLLLLRRPEEEVELECFMIAGEVGSIGWWSSMGPTGTVFITPNPPRSETKGDVGDRSSIRYLGC